MGKLIYSMTTSLDGYVSDKNGSIAWTKPNGEVLAYVNDMLRNVGTFLLGRSMSETLAVWDTISTDGPNDVMNDFAKIWRHAGKIVYSRTLSKTSMLSATLERSFSAEAINHLKSTSDQDLNIGGPHLAGAAIVAGLVDELHQFIVPTILGAGNYWLPTGLRVNLGLVDVRRFENGTVHLQYGRNSPTRR